MKTHGNIDRRSLAMARAIVALIDRDPERKGLKMFGAIEFFSGCFHYLECSDKFNADTYQQFIEQLLKFYKDPVFLIEDGAPYHRSAAMMQCKEKMSVLGRLFVERLPTYSLDKNPVEKLRKNTKKTRHPFEILPHL